MIKGLYRYRRLVFGVPSATAICQRILELILKDIPGVAVRVDDILITGHDNCGHFRILEAVLDKLYQKGIKLRIDKIKFMLRSRIQWFHDIQKWNLANRK